MVAVPAATPLISPVLLFTVATLELLEDQLPASPFDVKVVVPPTQIPCVPDKEPAFAAAVIAKFTADLQIGVPENAA